MQASVLDAKGLYTYANPLGQQSVPGAMTTAMNVNCDEIGITTTRRGFDFYSSQQFTVSGGAISKLWAYNSKLYASYNGGKLAQDNGSGTWTTYANFTMLPPSGGFIHQMLAGGNCYFTTSNGVYKISGTNATAPIQAGSPAALDTTLTVSGIISSGLLSAQSQCAYKIVWGYTDNSNLLILGAPSYAAFASNTNAAGAGNAVNVTAQFTIPPFIVGNQSLPWFYQVYRTPNTGSLTTPPGNNYQLVFQGNPAAGDYTNRYVSYADTTLDSLLAASLYTDDGQPNVGLAYAQPPLCQDSAYFNSMAFYANCSTLQSALLTLAGVGPANGIQSGDTVTLTSGATNYVYTGGAANNTATRTFAVYTAGTPSVNIQTTAQNLVSVINQDPNNSLFIIAYTSGYSGLPGAMKITAQNLSQGVFSVTSSRTTAWSPVVPASGTTYASSNNTLQNYLTVSLVSAPESVPVSQTVPVGSPNFSISRIVPVRTALIVIKPAEGVFLVTGTTPTTLTVTQLDTTAFIKGSETVSPLNNSGYFFTTQGVMLVNESGCEIMSRNVQGDILGYASSAYSNFSSLAFGVGYQSDNAYILFLQKATTDTYSTLQYRYNWITQAWTNWNINCTAAVVNPVDDNLYLATPDGFILKERKTFSNSDYADKTTTITINSIGTGTFTTASSANINSGDQISQVNGGFTYTCYVTANNTTTNVITVTTTTGFVTGSATDIASINSTVTFAPTTGGYPGFVKKFTTWNFQFSNVGFLACAASFTTDFYNSSEPVTLTPKLSNGWGTFPWGTVPWGVTVPAVQPIPTYATKNTAIGHWATVTLNIQQALQGFGLNGYTVWFDFLGQRSR